MPSVDVLDSESESEELPSRGNIGRLRDCCEAITKPVGSIFRKCCGYGTSGYLQPGPLGDREATLRHLARLARLVYGSGSTDKEDWGKYDPPLNGEGWEAVEQILETRHSESSIQAAMYLPARGSSLGACAVVAYRGTVSRKGIVQDASVAISGPSIRRAVREAIGFYRMCRQKHLDIEVVYITGHSLGGIIAEATASFVDAPGASFNSPGPWHPCTRNLSGPCRPDYEIHLTRDDPVAVLFPKPENSSHIGPPTWHPGKNHRCCRPYMIDIEEMQGVGPSGLQAMTEKEIVDQREALREWYAPPSELNSSSESDGSVAALHA